jgi:hypothetical protein
MNKHNFDKSAAPRRGVKTAAELRNLAYQLWAFECGRNCRAVARILNIAAYNIERWAVKESWAERAQRDLQAIMPDLLEQTAMNFRLAAFHVSQRVLAIAVAANNGVAPDPKEVDALVKIAGIGGFSPIGRNPLPPLPNRRAEPQPDLSKLSIEEIIARHHRALGLDA